MDPKFYLGQLFLLNKEKNVNETVVQGLLMDCLDHDLNGQKTRRNF
jgi:hypothetical protein